MRTNIDIDQDLLDEAIQLSGLKTKKAVVEKALSEYVTELSRKQALKNLWGIGWDGDLDEIRLEDMPKAGE
jgi:Arc/MetJ family transcription regulator